jgi:hypothetical protein
MRSIADGSIRHLRVKREVALQHGVERRQRVAGDGGDLHDVASGVREPGDGGVAQVRERGARRQLPDQFWIIAAGGLRSGRRFLVDHDMGVDDAELLAPLRAGGEARGELRRLGDGDRKRVARSD